MPDTINESIVIKCICGTSMRVRAAAAGKKAKCPTCGGIMTIPAVAGASSFESAPSDLGDLLPNEPVMSAEPIGGLHCPQCSEVIGAGAKVCVSCGYNVETGQTLTTAAGVAVAENSLGTFALGTALSGVGAAIGGVVWYLVAYYGNLEVGYIAWGVGVLAGLGMVRGHRAHTTQAGVMAAGMSALGIIGAKLAMFASFYAMLTSIAPSDASSIDQQSEFVANMMADDVLDARGITSDEKREAEWDSAHDEATDRVTKMSEDEIRAACRVYREKFNEALGQNEPFLSSFIRNEFTPFDLLWFFLALGSAFKIGRGATVGQT